MIGAPLFERTSRTVRLTPVGSQLRDDLQPVYSGLKDSVRRAQLAAHGVTGTLRVGMLPLNAYDLRPYWDVFRARHPQCGCASAAHSSTTPSPRCAAGTSTFWSAGYLWRNPTSRWDRSCSPSPGCWPSP